MTYNSWPLGKLPEHLRRPEPEQLKVLGYHWEDPRDIIGIFEEKLATYSGSRYCALVDCCSNGLFLALKARGLKNELISIPSRTYASVPMQIIHSGNSYRLTDQEWSGIYQLGKTGIWDSAARFTKDMFIGNGAMQVLSFQIKKRLPIGRGGAVLTDSWEEYNAIKLMSYDGRDLLTPYTDQNHIKTLGYHFYMTPEDAARGIMIMDGLHDVNEDTMDSSHYPDLREIGLEEVFSK